VEKELKNIFILLYGKKYLEGIDFSLIPKKYQKKILKGDIKYFMYGLKQKEFNNLLYIYNSCEWVGFDYGFVALRDINTKEIIYKVVNSFEDKIWNKNDRFTKIEKNTYNIFYLNNNLVVIEDTPNNESLFQNRPLIRNNIKINTSHKNGKDWIKHYFFNPKEGYLYFLKIKIGNIITNKIGISLDFSKRFNEEVEILESKIIKMNMLEAAILERAYHIILKGYRHYFSEEFAGKHECYRVDVNNINISINDAIKIINFEKDFNIPKNILIEVIEYQKEILNVKNS